MALLLRVVWQWWERKKEECQRTQKKKKKNSLAVQRSDPAVQVAIIIGNSKKKKKRKDVSSAFPFCSSAITKKEYEKRTLHFSFLLFYLFFCQLKKKKSKEIGLCRERGIVVWSAATRVGKKGSKLGVLGMPRNNQNVQRKRERDGDEERWKRRKKKKVKEHWKQHTCTRRRAEKMIFANVAVNSSGVLWSWASRAVSFFCVLSHPKRNYAAVTACGSRYRIREGVDIRWIVTFFFFWNKFLLVERRREKRQNGFQSSKTTKKKKENAQNVIASFFFFLFPHVCSSNHRWHNLCAGFIAASFLRFLSFQWWRNDQPFFFFRKAVTFIKKEKDPQTCWLGRGKKKNTLTCGEGGGGRRR